MLIRAHLQTLGKRFKESMPKLKTAISKLRREQIQQYESARSLDVEGCMLEPGDLKVISFQCNERDKTKPFTLTAYP